MKTNIKAKGVWHFECIDKNGKLKWEMTVENIVTNVGLQHMLDAEFASGAQVATWYIGLTDGTPTVAAADTMASHAGWTEVVAYDEAARQEWVDVRSGQSVTNSASKASFTISSDSTTIGGAFLTSSNTKSGSTGTLMSVVAFDGGDKSLDDNDTLNVTYTFSLADDGA